MIFPELFNGEMSKIWIFIKIFPKKKTSENLENVNFSGKNVQKSLKFENARKNYFPNIFNEKMSKI